MTFLEQTGTQIARTRRQFLRDAAGIAFGASLARSPLARAAAIPTNRKVVVITFGGGARDQETFAPEGQENVPNMLRDLIPRATFFTQVVNRGILGSLRRHCQSRHRGLRDDQQLCVVASGKSNGFRVLP